MNSVRLIFAGDTDADSIRLNSGSSMQDGVVTITKKLYFRVPDGQDPRAYSDLDVYGHPNFPQMYSAMPEDPRYKFYGNASVKHDLDDGHFFTAELEYTTEDPNATDSDGNPVTSETKPWELRPDNIEFSYPEVNVRFEASYNSTGKLYEKTGRDSSGNTVYTPVLPVANSAGDPFTAERTVNYIQMSFTFATRNWDVMNAIKYGNSINSKDITVCGLQIPAGQALLMPPECSYITVYEDNSSRVKWEYWSVRIVIKIDVNDVFLLQKILNVGDRAFFDEISFWDDLVGECYLPPEDGVGQICRFRTFVADSLNDGKYSYSQTGGVVFCSWNQFLAFRGKALAASAELSSPASSEYGFYVGGIVDPQCEQLTQMPLVATGRWRGYLDVDAIINQNYSSLEFRSYPYKSWSGLNLPKKGMKW